MVCSKAFWLTLVLTGLSSPVGADCALCDDLIEVDAAGAWCMREVLSQAAFPADGSPVLIDLAPCLGRATGVERGGLVTMPSFKEQLAKAQTKQVASSPSGPMKTAYLLDAKWGGCTGTLLRDHTVAAGDILTLDLLNQCP